MSDEQDWRLRVELADAAGFHNRLRDAHHFERELEPLVDSDVVLSYDEDTLFAYANTQEALATLRRAVEHQLASEGLSGQMIVSHWDDGIGEVGDWHQVDPPETAAEEAAEAQQPRADLVVTRNYVVKSGRVVNEYFEKTALEDAREAGVELSFTEHPHLLTTQISFTLTGPAVQVDTVIDNMKTRAMALTRLESFAI
jgi:hypothetical protein